MSGFVIVLLTVTALGGLAGCGFGLLWLRLRDATIGDLSPLKPYQAGFWYPAHLVFTPS
jgi:hypothetical protein